MGCLSWILEGKEPTNEESMITNEQLDERATELSIAYVRSKGINTNSVGYYGFLSATRAALEVDRESLRLMQDEIVFIEDEGVLLEWNAHITTLRKRLGLTA